MSVNSSFVAFYQYSQNVSKTLLCSNS